jgi:hypothetical protein
MGMPRRFGFGRRGAHLTSESALLAASRHEYLTPRDRFGPARQLHGRVYKSEAGVYLLVAPHLGAHDPVFSVGWARNDYWAVRVWGFDGNGFRNDFDPDAVATDAPLLQTLGWPHPLGYGETFACAKRLSDEPVMVSARYRFTDGEFESHIIHAAPRVTFHYDEANPRPADIAVAIELGLGGRRWEEHLVEIKAINRENSGRT